MKLIKSSIDKIIVKHCIVIGLDSKKEKQNINLFSKDEHDDINTTIHSSNEVEL